MQYIQNFINGHFCESSSGQHLDNFNPATGSVYSQIPDSNEDDIAAAIQAAEAAFPLWSALAVEERSRYLSLLAAKISELSDQFAEAESIDNGKPITLARQIDIPRAARNLAFFATGIQHFASESHSASQSINYTLRQPLGVVGCISPWNLPLYLLTWKIAPALAAGNCVVAKPSEVTPMTAYLLSQLCQEVGLPKGVLNIVHGLGPKTGQALCEDKRVKAISFTGSTRVGSQIAQLCAPQFKKVSLEMGGKNAALVFGDCDYEKMLDTLVRSSFSNQGQICLCTSRIFVQASLYERFKKDFVKKVKALRVGNPLDVEIQQGAVVSLQHYEKILTCLALARNEGASVLCGGEAIRVPHPCHKGWFVQPTVIEGLDARCRTNQEEIFGPVVSLIPFQTEQDVLDMANESQYGLTCSIWTQDISRAQRMSHQIETGMVWVNTWMNRDLRTPFGGVKSSGVGREGGWEALRFFTQVKNVCIEF